MHKCYAGIDFLYGEKLLKWLKEGASVPGDIFPSNVPQYCHYHLCCKEYPSISHNYFLTCLSSYIYVFLSACVSQEALSYFLHYASMLRKNIEFEKKKEEIIEKEDEFEMYDLWVGVSM